MLVYFPLMLLSTKIAEWQSFKVCQVKFFQNLGKTSHIYCLLSSLQICKSTTNTNTSGCFFQPPGLGFLLRKFFGEEELYPMGWKPLMGRLNG